MLRTAIKICRGFTLAEVTVALGIMSVFSAASIAVLIRMNRNAQSARLQTMALLVAQQKIDEILTAPWPDSSKPFPVGSETNVSVLLDDDPNRSGGTANYDMPVDAHRTTTISDTSNLRIKTAEVTVSYTYRQNPNATPVPGITLKTLRCTDRF